MAFALSVLSEETKSITIPKDSLSVLERYCMDCHDEDTKKGKINLEFSKIDWSSSKNKKLWTKVLNVIEDGSMPPKKKKQPTNKERLIIMKWLDESLLENTEFGGTKPRRLTKAEYQNTIRDLFSMPAYKLPAGFPPDSVHHGFNNLGEGLVTSAPLMESYSEVAIQVADQIFYKQKLDSKIKKRTEGPKDMVASFAASTVHGDALRLVSKADSMMRSTTWPSLMEVKTSGTYKITVSTSTFKPNSRGLHKGPMILEVRARNLTDSDRTGMKKLRLLKEITVNSEKPKTFTFMADLYEGQTLAFRWKNGLITVDPKQFKPHMTARLKKDKRLLAAWIHTYFPNGKGVHLGPLRGKHGWSIIKKHYHDKKLDMTHARMDSKYAKSLVNLFSRPNNLWNIHDTAAFDYHENGPALELHKVSMEGPYKIIEGPKDRERKRQQKHFTGSLKADASNVEKAEVVLKYFLPKAFRRPVDQKTVDIYLKIVKQHWKKGHSFEDGMHLLIQSVLISPRFLYKSLNSGKLDDYDLATRLSYMLTQRPPDSRLVSLAKQGKLSDPKVLRAEAERLLPNKKSRQKFVQKSESAFIKDFTDQWLQVYKLNDIMPDPSFRFSDMDLSTAAMETRYFFTEILLENLPVKEFIDPDFMYTTGVFANKYYGTKNKANKKDKSMRKYSIKRGHIHGGLLGQSTTMIVTANGVDTQPVLRGVWILENILGMAPPPPPTGDIPALTPDTTGAVTPRQMLTKHTKDPKCAGCHQKIDPVGFVFENFNPVGKWRKKWPKSPGVQQNYQSG